MRNRKETVMTNSASGRTTLISPGTTVRGDISFSGHLDIEGGRDIVGGHRAPQALELQAKGCFSLVLEHIPAELAAALQQMLEIPVIGIGAGTGCDGQVRVTADLLGLTPEQPPFSPALIPGRQLCVDALRGWVDRQRQPEASPTSTPAPPAPDC
mgnify:CR=1 FL=1